MILDVFDIAFDLGCDLRAMERPGACRQYRLCSRPSWPTIRRGLLGVEIGGNWRNRSRRLRIQRHRCIVFSGVSIVGRNGTRGRGRPTVVATGRYTPRRGSSGRSLYCDSKRTCFCSSCRTFVGDFASDFAAQINSKNCRAAQSRNHVSRH